ncbi:MAG: hypothetical protein ACI3Y2_02690 [Candidatus Egerieousia sp.]
MAQDKEKKENKKMPRTEFKEIGRVAALERLFETTEYKNSEVQEFVGSVKDGDSSVDYNYLTTNKIMLEGIDFDLTYTPIKYLGYKAAVNAMGSLYARCYKPYKMSFSIAVSGKFSYEHVDWLWTGIRAAAKEHGVENVTLELRSSLTGLIISCTAVGRQRKDVVEKFPKVEKNALICVTGNMGAAYMGLHVLEREKVAFGAQNRPGTPSENSGSAPSSNGYKQPDLSRYKYILSRYLTPEIDGECIEKFASAGFYPCTGYFMTRGLGDAVKQLAKDTGFGAKIFLKNIPIASETRQMAEEIDIDVITAVINGGDDYRTLYVVPLDKHEAFIKEFKEADVIGHLCAAETENPADSCSLITPEGNSIAIQAQGW